MSYVEILILRRLRSGPAHGYELRKRVEETTGFVLHNNSLYPALRRFEEAGDFVRVVTTPHHPHLLWVHEHLQHLSSHIRAIGDPAAHVAEQRRLPWWR